MSFNFIWFIAETLQETVVFHPHPPCTTPQTTVLSGPHGSGKPPPWSPISLGSRSRPGKSPSLVRSDRSAETIELLSDWISRPRTGGRLQLVRDCLAAEAGQEGEDPLGVKTKIIKPRSKLLFPKVATVRSVQFCCDFLFPVWCKVQTGERGRVYTLAQIYGAFYPVWYVYGIQNYREVAALSEAA